VTLLRPFAYRRGTLTDEISVDPKLCELKHVLGVLGDFNLRGGVDMQHSWEWQEGKMRQEEEAGGM